MVLPSGQQQQQYNLMRYHQQQLQLQQQQIASQQQQYYSQQQHPANPRRNLIYYPPSQPSSSLPEQQQQQRYRYQQQQFCDQYHITPSLSSGSLSTAASTSAVAAAARNNSYSKLVPRAFINRATSVDSGLGRCLTQPPQIVSTNCNVPGRFSSAHTRGPAAANSNYAPPSAHRDVAATSALVVHNISNNSVVINGRVYTCVQPEQQQQQQQSTHDGNSAQQRKISQISIGSSTSSTATMRDKSLLTVLPVQQQQQQQQQQQPNWAQQHITTGISSSDEIDEGCYDGGGGGGAAGSTADDIAAARRYRRGDSGQSNPELRGRPLVEPKPQQQQQHNTQDGERALTAVEDRWKTVFGQMESQRPPVYSAGSYVEQLKRFALMLKDPALSAYVWLAQRSPPPQTSSTLPTQFAAAAPFSPPRTNGYPNNLHAPSATAGSRAATMLFGNGNYQNYPNSSSNTTNNLITAAAAAAAKRSRSMPAAPNRLSLSGFFSSSANKSHAKQQQNSSVTLHDSALPPVPSNHVQILRATPALTTAAAPAASSSSISSSRSSVLSSSHSADNIIQDPLQKPTQTAVAANNVVDRRAANAAIDSPNLSVLLKRLKQDMKLSSLTSFRVEFIELDGLHWLLEILKAVQEKTKRTCGLQPLLSSTSSSNSEMGGGERRGNGNNSNPQDMKSAAVDELSVLLSIKYCSKSPEALDQLMDMMPAVPCVCNSLASSSVKVRIVVLQILSDIMTRNDAQGFRLTLDAMTTLRLRLSEPVRFKILVGMMSSNGALALPFQAACMHFINKLLACAETANQRVLLQGELEEAGLDVLSVETLANADRSCQDFNALRAVREEIYTYKSNYVDVQLLLDELKSLRQAAQQQNGSERAASRASSSSHSSATSTLNNTQPSSTQPNGSYSNGHHHQTSADDYQSSTNNGYNSNQQAHEPNARRAPYATAETCYSEDENADIEISKSRTYSYTACASSMPSSQLHIPTLPLKTSMMQYRQQQQRLNPLQQVPYNSPRRNRKIEEDGGRDEANDGNNSSVVVVRQVADLRRNFESNINANSSNSTARRHNKTDDEDDFIYDEYEPQPTHHLRQQQQSDKEDEDFKTYIQVQPPSGFSNLESPHSSKDNSTYASVATIPGASSSAVVETRAAGRICHRIPEEPEFEHTDREHDADNDDDDDDERRRRPPQQFASAANRPKVNNSHAVTAQQQQQHQHLHVRASSNSDSDSGHHSPTATSSTTSSSSSGGRGAADSIGRPKSAGSNAHPSSLTAQTNRNDISSVTLNGAQNASQRFASGSSSPATDARQQISGSMPTLTASFATTVVNKKQRWMSSSSESSVKPALVATTTTASLSTTVQPQKIQSPAEAATLRMMEKVLNEFDKICDTTDDYEPC